MRSVLSEVLKPYSRRRSFDFSDEENFMRDAQPFCSGFWILSLVIQLGSFADH
jgi:hypothetical protein